MDMTLSPDSRVERKKRNRIFENGGHICHKKKTCKSISQDSVFWCQQFVNPKNFGCPVYEHVLT